MKKIYLISNDKIWISNKKYTSNNDLDNIITCLKDEYDVNLICRKSIKKLFVIYLEKNGENVSDIKIDIKPTFM